MSNTINKNLLAPVYAKYLEEIDDVEIDYLYYNDELEDFYKKNMYNKALFKLLPRIALKNINDGIRKKIDSYLPDIIWIFKGMEIFPETLEYAKSKGASLVSFNPDHPFRFVSSGSGNRFVSDSLRIYDLHFTYSRKTQKELKEKFNINAIILPFGYEIPDEFSIINQPLQEINKLGFIGFADRERKRVVEILTDAGIPIDVYGPRWKQFGSDSDLLKIKEPVFGRNYWNTLRKYRAQINIFRDHNDDSHNMRSFEIPAIGGIMLAPWSNEHSLFFESGKEFYAYRNENELVESAKSLLNMPSLKADKIRAAARNRCIVSGYSYKERAKFVSNVFRERFSKYY